MQLISLLIIALFLSVRTPSQRAVVLPRYFNTSVRFGFGELGCSGWARVQNLFYVDSGASGTATGIALRRYFDPLNVADMPAYTVELELRMGHSRRSAAVASMRFAENHDADLSNVVRRRVFNFPRVPGQTQGPYPFSFRMPFDTPFALTANRWALWEAYIHTSSNCNFWEFAPELAGHDPGTQHPITDIGQKCPAGWFDNQLSVGRQHLGVRTQVLLGSETAVNPNNIPVLFIGTRSDTWLGQTLPVNLTPIGATGCFVNISLDLVWPPAMTLGQGWDTALFMFEVPNDGRLLGKDIYWQGARFGSPSNRAGIVTSQGVHTRIGPPSLSEGAFIVSGRNLSPYVTEYGQKLLMSYVTEMSLR